MRENVKLYDVYIRRQAKIHESIICLLIRRCRIWQMRFSIF